MTNGSDENGGKPRDDASSRDGDLEDTDELRTPTATDTVEFELEGAEDVGGVPEAASSTVDAMVADAGAQAPIQYREGPSVEEEASIDDGADRFNKEMAYNRIVGERKVPPEIRGSFGRMIEDDGITIKTIERMLENYVARADRSLTSGRRMLVRLLENHRRKKSQERVPGPLDAVTGEYEADPFSVPVEGVVDDGTVRYQEPVGHEDETVEHGAVGDDDETARFEGVADEAFVGPTDYGDRPELDGEGSLDGDSVDDESSVDEVVSEDDELPTAMTEFTNSIGGRDFWVNIEGESQEEKVRNLADVVENRRWFRRKSKLYTHVARTTRVDDSKDKRTFAKLVDDEYVAPLIKARKNIMDYRGRLYSNAIDREGNYVYFDDEDKSSDAQNARERMEIAKDIDMFGEEVEYSIVHNVLKVIKGRNDKQKYKRINDCLENWANVGIRDTRKKLYAKGVGINQMVELEDKVISNLFSIYVTVNRKTEEDINEKVQEELSDIEEYEGKDYRRIVEELAERIGLFEREDDEESPAEEYQGLEAAHEDAQEIDGEADDSFNGDDETWFGSGDDLPETVVDGDGTDEALEERYGLAEESLDIPAGEAAFMVGDVPLETEGNTHEDIAGEEDRSIEIGERERRLIEMLRELSSGYQAKLGLEIQDSIIPVLTYFRGENPDQIMDNIYARVEQAREGDNEHITCYAEGIPIECYMELEQMLIRPLAQLANYVPVVNEDTKDLVVAHIERGRVIDGDHLEQIVEIISDEVNDDFASIMHCAGLYDDLVRIIGLENGYLPIQRPETEEEIIYAVGDRLRERREEMAEQLYEGLFGGANE